MSLIDTDLNDALREWLPWIYTRAARMTTTDKIDDLTQEGLIAAWKAHLSYDGRAPLNWWVKYKATNRMHTVVSRDWQTRQQQFNRADALNDTSPYDHDMDDSTLQQNDIALAIIRAIDLERMCRHLTPRQREYLYLRCWLRWTEAELTEYFGYNPRGVIAGIKKKLTSFPPQESISA